MQLLFLCPQTGREFRTDRWRVEGSMATIVRNGQKALDGRVLADCPCCGEVHAYEPDRLSCPLGSGQCPGA
jgi:hypothetical protein